MAEQEYHSGDEQASVSVSQAQAQAAAQQRTNEQIHSKRLYCKIQKSNHLFDLAAFRGSNELLVEILKGHHIYTALTAFATVPNVYVQQVWHSLKLGRDAQGGTTMVFDLDEFQLSIGPNFIKRMLGLPKREHYGIDEYEPFATEEELLADLRRLGYMEDIQEARHFRRTHLPGLYYDLFGIILKCLSTQFTDLDKSSLSF